MKFDTIEIHFRTQDDKKRRVIITPGGDVEAIFLGGDEGPKVTEVPKAKGLELVGEVEGFYGPVVCYQINGNLQCW